MADNESEWIRSLIKERKMCQGVHSLGEKSRVNAKKIK